MTVQSSDYVYLNGRKYVLIDVEKDKQLIDSADFKVPEIESVVISTGCRRNYTANYFVENGELYGIKSVQMYGNADFISEKIKMNYTGSIIIAYESEKLNISDFLDCYLDYEEAYELYFENGVIKEEYNLNIAIQHFKQIQLTHNYKNNMFPNQCMDLRKKLAYEYLKYLYDDIRSYKWRKSDPAY